MQKVKRGSSRLAFSMVELILSIVIMGILSSGAYLSLKKLFQRTAKSKAISELSFDSTLVSNQIVSLLENRIPSSVIGYDSSDGSFESIYSVSKSYPILEWLSIDKDAYIDGKYSGFVNFDECDKSLKKINSPDTIEVNASKHALIFAGAFDEGSVVYGSDFNDSFGWHEKEYNQIFEINSSSSGEEIYLLKKPDVIYEKYFLVESAYSIARYEDINQSASCIDELGVEITDNSLFLFYNFRPWKGESFCADKNGTRAGAVTILSNEVSGFEVNFVNGVLQFNLSLHRNTHKIDVNISKQKALL